MTLGPLMIDVEGAELSEQDCKLLQHPLIGGVILFARNYQSRDQVRELTTAIHALRSPPLLIAVDHEGGRVQRFREGFTELPPMRWLGHQYDSDARQGRELAILHARLMATELIDAGVDFSFAPVLDIDRGLCEVIGDRSPHATVEGVSALGLAYMQGMRQAGMAAVAKHFPGHGGVVGDSHLMLPEDRREYSQLLDDMQPYSSLIADGLKGVMMAHIHYSSVCPDVASLSPMWVQQILRQQLGFGGAIFSDDLSMAGVEIAGDTLQRTQLALKAGADMILICNDRPAVERVLELLPPQDNLAGHARLAAMRPVTERYQAMPYGETDWQQAVETIVAAAAPPPLELDGEP